MDPFSAANSREVDVQTAKIRRLAHALLSDHHAVDDLVQEAWLIALERPPKDQGSFGAWFTRVVYNLALTRWRNERARRDREAKIARSDREDSHAELIERLDVVERLLGNVRKLDEPYRDVILMRYFEELSAAEVAARLGVPIRTVHTRTSRALELLRTRLDRQDGDQRRWLGALVPLAGLTRDRLLAAVLYKMKTKVAVLCAVLVLLGFMKRFSGPTPLHVSKPVLAAAERIDLDSPSAADETSRSDSIEDEALLAATSAPRTIERAARLHGIVVDAADQPVAGVPIVFRESRAAPALEGFAATSDGHGRFVIRDPAREGLLDVADREHVLVLEPRVRDRGEEVDYVVVIAARAPLEGRVIDLEGEPVAGAEVRLFASNVRTELVRDLDACATPHPRASTDANGRFEFEDAPDLFAQVIASSPGFDNRDAFSDPLERAPLEIVLAPTQPTWTYLVHGRVVDPSGEPIDGAYVYAEPRRAAYPELADRNGAFALQPPSVDRTQGPWSIAAAAPGFLPTSIASTAAIPRSASDWPAPLVITLSKRTASIEGTLFDCDGRTVAGAEIELLDGTGFADVTRAHRVPGPEILEDVLAGRAAGEHATTRADGSFALGGLLEREYRLRFVDPRRLSSIDTDPIAAGSRDVFVRMPSASRSERVAGRVLDSDGNAIAGARVQLLADLSEGRDRAAADGLGLRAGEARVTDRAGRFAFEDVRADVLDTLCVFAPASAMPATFGARDRCDLAELELVVPRMCHAQIDLRASEIEADYALVEDPSSTRAWMSLAEGDRPLRKDAIELVRGRSQSFALSDDATAIRLFRGRRDGEHELAARIELRLDPRRFNVVRP